jgi:hypothetical protein
MEKLTAKDRGALKQARKGLVETIDNYLEYCILFGDVNRLKRFTSSLKDFIDKEAELIKEEKAKNV